MRCSYLTVLNPKSGEVEVWRHLNLQFGQVDGDIDGKSDLKTLIVLATQMD